MEAKVILSEICEAYSESLLIYKIAKTEIKTFESIYNEGVCDGIKKAMKIVEKYL